MTLADSNTIHSLFHANALPHITEQHTETLTVATNKKWNELMSIAEMSQDQWGHFKERLAEHLHAEPLAVLVDKVVQGEPKPRRKAVANELGNIRSRKNRPQRGSMPALDRRLQRLLGLLQISDPPDDVFDGRVYLALDNDEVKYVGSGNNERVSRFSGLRLPTYEPHAGLCLLCLESMTLWLCRLGGHPVEASKRSPILCAACREEWLLGKIVPAVRDSIGALLSCRDILKVLEIVARREERQL